MKQYYNKFNEDFKNGPSQNYLLKKEWSRTFRGSATARNRQDTVAGGQAIKTLFSYPPLTVSQDAPLNKSSPFISEFTCSFIRSFIHEFI